jgi:DNA invertase Pin-like site-specific DNA recombinase
MAKAREPRGTKGKRGSGQTVGYLRVSSLDQKELRQLDGIKLDKRFVDKASGKDLHRPELEQLTSYVREGDTVICHSMDRLARNLDDPRKVVLGFTDRGVRELREGESDLYRRGLPDVAPSAERDGRFAQFERDLIRERQREGIALAKLREGAYVGRKPSLNPPQAKDLRRRVPAGESKTALAGELGISRMTLYRYAAGVGK